MPRHSLFLTTVLCLVAPMAHALDGSQCGSIEEQAFSVLDADFNIEITQSPTSTAQALLNGCASSHLDIFAEDIGLMFRAGRLLFTGDNLIEWARGEVVLPTQLQLRLDDVILTDQFAAVPQMSWLQDLVGSNQPAQIDLQWAWAPATQHLTLHALHIDFGNDNSATLEFDGQAVGWHPYDISTDEFGMTRIDLSASLNGVFEQAIVAPLAANGVDMSPFTLAFVAAGIQSLVAQAPPSVLSVQSGAEVVAFAQTLPAPRGQLQLTLASPTPFNLDRIATDLRSGVPFDAAVPQGFSIAATWVPFH